MLWTSELGELIPGGSRTAGNAPTDFQKNGITPGSFGPRRHDHDGASSLPACQTSVGSQGLFSSVSTFKHTVCLLCSGQMFSQDPSGSLHGQTRSVLGESYNDTPMVVPTRAWLDEVRRFMRGDYYIGRRATQRGLTQRLYCNNYKVCQCTGERKRSGDSSKSSRKIPYFVKLSGRCRDSVWSATASEHRNVMATPSFKNSLDRSRKRMIAQPQRPHRLPLKS